MTETRAPQHTDDTFLFSSESVTEGHPDKIADQISDGVLDAILAQDPSGRVACETLITTGLILVAGEITTAARVDVPQIARETVRKIGYNDAVLGFDASTCAVLTAIDEQSPDIAQGVDLAFGRTLPRLLRDAGLVDVQSDAYFPMGGPACSELERATVEQIRERLIAAGLATEDEIAQHLASVQSGRLDLATSPMVSAWARKP